MKKNNLVFTGLAVLAVSLTSINVRGIPPPPPATYCVDDVNDVQPPNAGDCPADGSCSGNCSLRDAITATNAGGGSDTINVHLGNHRFSGTTADQGEDSASKGDLDIATSVTIVGAGAGTTFVDGNGIDRVFHVIGPASARISGLTIRNGNPGSSDYGGGVLSSGALTLTNCVVSGNTTGFNGGGLAVSNPGSLTLRNSTVSDNAAGVNGGGLAMIGLGGGFTIVNSTISGNRANGGGGGLSVNNDLSLFNVTLTGNTADNDASGGANEDGGGIRVIGGNMLIQNSILAGNTDAGGVNNPDCSNDGGGIYVAGSGYNLVGKIDGCSGNFTHIGDQTGTIVAPLDPRLAALAGNGGPTQTHALQAFSPAQNLGDPAGCLDSDGLTVLPTDQRGFARPIPAGGRCDIGAYENGTCGDGAVDIGEACDDGNASNNDSCLNDCSAASCGDGFVETGVEGCDDGNADNADACLNTCISATCGDGAVQSSVEQCDDGSSNGNEAADACRMNCTNPRCGDGVVDAGESCDDGNTDNADSCKNDCTPSTSGGTTGTVSTVSGGCSLIR